MFAIWSSTDSLTGLVLNANKGLNHFLTMAPGIGFSILLVAFSTILTYFLAKFLRVYFLISKFDGPPALPFFGNSLQFKSDQRGI